MCKPLKVQEIKIISKFGICIINILNSVKNVLEVYTSRSNQTGVNSSLNKGRNVNNVSNYISNSAIANPVHSVVFPKAERFRNIEPEGLGGPYLLPDIKNKRSTNLGYGERVNFAREDSPSPGTYKLQNFVDYNNKHKNFTIAGRLNYKVKNTINILIFSVILGKIILAPVIIT